MDTGHAQSTPVELVYENPDVDRVAVIGGPRGLDPVDPWLRRGEDGLWRRTWEAPSNVRTTYVLAPGGNLQDPSTWVADPRNPRTYVFPRDDEIEGDEDWVSSLLELPDAPPYRWSVERGVPRGELVLERIASRILGNERRVWLYTPPGFDPGERYGCLLLFDGGAYTWQGLAPAPTVLDNLLAEGRIPPLVGVFVDSLDNDTRTRELSGNEDFLGFLADELLPWARERLPIEGRITLGGSSLGGYASTHAALERSDLFGAVLSQSGAYQYPVDGGEDPERIARMVAGRPRAPVRFWLDAGLLETVPSGAAPSILVANRHLRRLLEVKGYDLAGYREFPGGHDYLWWRETLAEGLVALHGR